MANGARKKTVIRWVWPISLVATAAAGIGVVLFRGCRHRKMSWPVRAAGECYQVCTGCGIKRLFNEESFSAYGPFSYDLDKLIAHKRRQNISQPEPYVSQHRSAS